ncbi:hypothetical protein LWM68_10815 [Niabella sp. W65]|nr:hypothetical protein [Niabella sp. W65]MCH7363212.1 hypothetical protein [Niabella sp. W65]
MGYVTRTRTPEYVDGYEYAKLVNEALTTRNREPLYSPNELEIIRNNLDPDLYPNVDWMNLMLRPYTNNVNASLNFKGVDLQPGILYRPPITTKAGCMKVMLH